MHKKKNPAAVALGKRRWQPVTPEARSVAMRKVRAARTEKQRQAREEGA